MTFTALGGDSFWHPRIAPGLIGREFIVTNDTVLLDANEEEGQIIGDVHIDGGGTKTFGGGSSALGWLPGASIAFAVGSTLTVGVKKAASVDTANGPAARATIGAAAFDVFATLVGGVDTITTTTWRNEAMVLGTPFSVADGDRVAICWHLATVSGTPAVRVRLGTPTSQILYPATTLVTAGPTYTAVTAFPNMMLIFSDGTLGWLSPTVPFSAATVDTGTIGITNIFGNIVRFPFGVQINGLAAIVNPTASDANFALDVYSTPLGTPVQMASVTHDANVINVAGGTRYVSRRLPTAITLDANTDYAVGVRQTTATAVAASIHAVNTATYFRAMGASEACYAVTSTAGATFASVSSGTRRHLIWVRVSAVEVTALAIGLIPLFLSLGVGV